MPTYDTRAEHLAWCQRRAHAELDADPTGDGPSNAVASMTSDLAKHPETAMSAATVGHLGMAELLGGGTVAGVRRWIDGVL